MYQAGRWYSRLSLLLLSTWTLLAWTACVHPSTSNRQGLIWEARRGQQLVTLVGTMHVGISPREIPQGLWKRLETAETVVTEVDLGDMNGTLMRRYLVLPDKENLERMMGTEDWKKFKATVQEAFPHIPEQQLQRMSPLAACSNLMLAEAQLAQQAQESKGKAKGRNIRDEVSMDQYIIEKSREQKKQLKTFETLEEQFDFLGKVFTLEQLKEMLAESAENRKYYEQLSTSFKEGDSETIDDMVGSMPANLREILLDQRNVNWGKKMNEVLSPRETIIAVGAAHLGGEKGLIAIMEAQGFKLKPVKL